MYYVCLILRTCLNQDKNTLIIVKMESKLLAIDLVFVDNGDDTTRHFSSKHDRQQSNVLHTKTQHNEDDNKPECPNVRN